MADHTALVVGGDQHNARHGLTVSVIREQRQGELPGEPRLEPRQLLLDALLEGAIGQGVEAELDADDGIGLGAERQLKLGKGRDELSTKKQASAPLRIGHRSERPIGALREIIEIRRRRGKGL